MTRYSTPFLKTVLGVAMAALLGAGAGPLLAEPGADAVPGPLAQMRITEDYARMVARDAYFWAWPMVNVYTRRLAAEQRHEIVRVGAVPVSPPNRLGMLTDYMPPEMRSVACPNQDVVYGGASLALDKTPVVVQVPDFGTRYWTIPAYDLRTDQFTALGSQFGSQPGFYLLVGPDWKGEVPRGIRQVFRAKSNTGLIVARVFMDDTAEDRQAIQDVLSKITIYPLAEFTGQVQVNDWKALKQVPVPPTPGGGEFNWVTPERFFDILPRALADARPQAGEAARYAQVLAVLDAAQRDPALKRAMITAAGEADQELVRPLIQFRRWGLQRPYHWTWVSNGAQFGTDYFTRTAIARSNIFVNRPEETLYFYQDLDASGDRLNGAKRYQVTFAKGQLPPVKGFWSLTLYDEQHFFAPNALGRYSLGTKNQALRYADDGSLTLYIQAESPGADKEANWLPAPKNADFSLYLRAYSPAPGIASGDWTPPAVNRLP